MSPRSLARAASLGDAGHLLQPALHTVTAVLPVHYWQDWAPLFDPHGTADLGTGIVTQIATVAVATALAALTLARRDPAA